MLFATGQSGQLTGCTFHLSCSSGSIPFCVDAIWGPVHNIPGSKGPRGPGDTSTSAAESKSQSQLKKTTSDLTMLKFTQALCSKKIGRLRNPLSLLCSEDTLHHMTQERLTDASLPPPHLLIIQPVTDTPHSNFLAS